ncbi:hypothetical protein D3C76_1616140 [compost metagenome]
MKRIDHEALLQPKPFEQPTGLYGHAMAGAILHFQWCVLRLAMIEEPWQLLDTLVQGAAQGDVQFLKSTADAEHRHTGGNGGLQ